jgi:hypothetical protein
MSDQLRQLSMAVCAARLDSGVSAEDFTEAVEKLIDCARADGTKAGMLAGAIRQIGKRAEPDPANEDPPPSTETAPNLHPGAARRRLSYDDKTRMRQQYAAAMDGRQRAPNGFLDKMANEYGVSIATVKDTLYHGDGT